MSADAPLHTSHNGDPRDPGTNHGSAVERHLFIAGCPRSGTSALAFLLNEHPQIVLGFERFKRTRALLESFHFTPAQFFSPVLAETDIRGELLYRRLRARWRSGSVAVIGDKVPLYWRVLPELLERFPRGRLVLLVRDLQDVAISFDRRARDPGDWWPAENDRTLAVKMWSEALERVRDAELAGHGERIFLLPYEPLLAGEERWLQALLSFIGLPSTASITAEHQRLAARWSERRSEPAEPGLISYIENHRDPALQEWAQVRMGRQLQSAAISEDSAGGLEEPPFQLGTERPRVEEGVPFEEPPPTTTELAERDAEREQLLAEMRRPGARLPDEAEVLERRLLEQSRELVRYGALLGGAAPRPPRQRTQNSGEGSAIETHLFIAGCPRSGTSAAVYLLNEHPNLAIGLERFKLVRAHLDPFHFAPSQFFSPLARETDIRGELLYERLRARWDAGQVTVIGDKVPLYTRILPRLLERFPAARVVVLVRDPLDVAVSFCRRARDPEDRWPAENDHRLALELWNEALANVRAIERRGEGERIFLLPYEPLLAGDERWLQALISFIGVPPSERLVAEQRRLAAEWRQRLEGRERDAELAAYAEAHRDPELSAWARERMGRQLERLSTIDLGFVGSRTVAGVDETPAVVGVGGPSLATDELLPGGGAPSPVNDGIPMDEARAPEREELNRELRSPEPRGADELEVLERRLVEQAGELVRRGERVRRLASSKQPARAPSSNRSYEGRVTLVLPHQRETTGGVYAIEQFARHLSEHLPVTAVVRASSTRPIPGVPVRAAAELDADALPHADVLLYPVDMKDAERILDMPKSVGRPVALFQGYGTPGSSVVNANLEHAEEAVAIAHWLVEDALRHGTPCAYVPYGLDRALFSPGQPARERAARVSVMTHHLDWKGLADALEALALVRLARPDVEVVLFGVEPVEGVGRFLASPSRAEVAQLLGSCAVHLVASWEEGFGMTGAEALACGAALATTDTKGSRDYALDGATALVSPPRDPGALADNVLRLLDDARLRERLVTAGQRHLRGVMPPWPEAARRMATALLER